MAKVERARDDLYVVLDFTVSNINFQFDVKAWHYGLFLFVRFGFTLLNTIGLFRKKSRESETALTNCNICFAHCNMFLQMEIEVVKKVTYLNKENVK